MNRMKDYSVQFGHRLPSACMIQGHIILMSFDMI